MAFVFEANHTKLQQRVAIKLLAPAFRNDTELVARFEREGRAIARLSTKHVVRVTDVDATAEGLPFMVMEFLEGNDLDAELHTRTRLPLGESINFILQASSGMLEAHEVGIVHRDLKPANLFLASEREGADRVVKVLDFGISKVAGESAKLTGMGTVMGTVLYMSPEQVRADSDVDRRADIWSLGVILFELLSGRAPFDGSPQQIAAKIVSSDPPDLRTLIDVPEGVALGVRRMLERERDRRFSSLTDVIAALGPFAPMGSIGSAIADKHPLKSSARGKTALLTAKRTIPMAGAPAFADRPSSSSGASRAAVPTPPPATSLSAERARALNSRGRLILVLAILVGLLGSVGAVLTLVALLRPKATRDHGSAPLASPAAAVRSSVLPGISPIPSTAPLPSASPSTSAVPTALPAATVNAGRPSKKDAGAGRGPSTSAPPAVSADPVHL